MDFRFFEIYRKTEYLWLIGEGALMSVALTVASGALGFLLAVGLASARMQSIWILRTPAAAFVEFFRNTPLLVQLFFIAFGLPRLLDYRLDMWQHIAIGLTLNFSAYFTEILRAGFLAVPQQQIEAAHALGLKKRSVFWKVIFPQAVANMYPALNSQFIFLFLTTGVISVFGVRDLTYAGDFINGRDFITYEVFLILALIYILISFTFKGILFYMKNILFRWKTAS